MEKSSITRTVASGEPASTVLTTKSRSMSVFSSILWVIWKVNSEKPTLLS